MKAPKGMVVDHIDGNGLNNRRSNLRLCTPQQNQWNRCVSRARLQQGLFKGVHHRTDSGKPCARITYRGKTLHLGVFDTAIEAAKAYDRKAIELHGEFAYLNFPEDYDRQAPQSPARGREPRHETT
ncbi:MAG: HNH endonuclease [Sedimentisphaerales bacterium]|nr:HNH endonuclease [Sedimentisphaerales bacterium]